MLSSLPNILHFLTRLTKIITIHDRPNITILTEILTNHMMATTTYFVESFCFLLELRHEDVQTLWDVGEYPSEVYCSVVNE